MRAQDNRLLVLVKKGMAKENAACRVTMVRVKQLL
jgi:hypothetical protein